jgi:hypothetical protein
LPSRHGTGRGTRVRRGPPGLLIAYFVAWMRATRSFSVSDVTYFS